MSLRGGDVIRMWGGFACHQKEEGGGLVSQSGSCMDQVYNSAKGLVEEKGGLNRLLDQMLLFMYF